MIIPQFQVTYYFIFAYINAFKKKIGFLKLLSTNFSFKKAPNSIFQTYEVIDYMIDSVILEYTCFLHMDELRNDAVYGGIEGHKLPSQKVCRDLIKAMPKAHLKN